MDVDPRLQPVGVGLNEYNFQSQQFNQHYPVYNSSDLNLHGSIDSNPTFVQDPRYFQRGAQGDVQQQRRRNPTQTGSSGSMQTTATLPSRSLQDTGKDPSHPTNGPISMMEQSRHGGPSIPRQSSTQSSSLPTPPSESLGNPSDKPQDPTTFTSPAAARPLVPNPPNLAEWRQKFFNIREPLLLTSEEYHTYFPHIDNVYSHRSTQKYKKKPFVSHYWDCRLKGRPTGTPLNKNRRSGAGSGDEVVEKKTRKRKVRERDLCDVKIKVTEFFGRDELDALGKLGLGPEPTNAGEEQTGELTFILDEQGVSGNAGGSDMPFGVLEPMKKFPEGHPGAEGKRWYMIQRVSGTDNGTKDGGVENHELDHKHSLEESDRIKKNSVQRWIMAQEKEKKKQAKGKGIAYLKSPSIASTTASDPISIFHASGRAEQTVKTHSAPVSSALTFYSNSYCPFAQRIWIALELIGIPYQYVEITEKQIRDGVCLVPELLAVHPDGTIPCIRHGNFAVWESIVVLEYLEDLAMGHSLFPVGDPQLKAHSRLWTDHLNRKILPAFYALLLTPRSEKENWHYKSGIPPLDERRSMLITTLQEAITKLVNASHRTGPYFLGDRLSYVDVAFAPWILRLSRVLSYYRDFPRPEIGTRWQTWVDAIERNEFVRRTKSEDLAYHNVYGGVGEDSYDGTMDNRRSFAEIRYAQMIVRQEGFGLGGDVWAHIQNDE